MRATRVSKPSTVETTVVVTRSSDWETRLASSSNRANVCDIDSSNVFRRSMVRSSIVEEEAGVSSTNCSREPRRVRMRSSCDVISRSRPSEDARWVSSVRDRVLDPRNNLSASNSGHIVSEDESAVVSWSMRPSRIGELPRNFTSARSVS